MTDQQTQIDALKQQLGDVTSKLAKETRARVEAEKIAGQQPQILPPGEAPVYELASPYYSPDDVFYPEGAQFEDITGTIVPNESMIPLNAAAERRVTEWLARQPSKTRTPPLELIMQAAMELRPKEGVQELPVEEFMKSVMNRAIERHCANLGIKADDAPRSVTRRPDANVPLMSNTKINNQVGSGQRPAATRLRQDAVAPANKAAAPTGARSTNLGSGASPGVVASR